MEETYKIRSKIWEMKKIEREEGEMGGEGKKRGRENMKEIRMETKGEKGGWERERKGR